MSVYGYCPRCGGAGISRERRPGGNDRCENGHSYPSATAVANTLVPPETKREDALAALNAILLAEERAAVVAWLHAEVEAAMDMNMPVRAETFLACAEAIERGEHRRKEKA